MDPRQLPITYVRWRKDQPRATTTLPALHTSHPAAGNSCLFCDQQIGHSDPVTLYALGPHTPESRDKHAAGDWYLARALVVHATCLGLEAPQVGEPRV